MVMGLLNSEKDGVKIGHVKECELVSMPQKKEPNTCCARFSYL